MNDNRSIETSSVDRFLEAVALAMGLPKKQVEQMFHHMDRLGKVEAPLPKIAAKAPHKRNDVAK